MGECNKGCRVQTSSIKIQAVHSIAHNPYIDDYTGPLEETRLENFPRRPGLQPAYHCLDLDNLLIAWYHLHLTHPLSLLPGR